MNAIFEQINLTGKAFVEFAWPMLVQSSLLILILLLADLLLRRKVRAVFRYWVWLLILVKLVLPTSLSSPVSLGYLLRDELELVKLGRTDTVAEPAVVLPPSDMQQPVEPESIAPTVRPLSVSRREPAAVESVAEPAVGQPVPVTPLSWQGAVFLAWLAVVAAMGLLLLQRAIFVQGLVAQPNSTDALMSDMLEQCRRRIGVNRKVGLKVSPNATSPAVCGLFRPVILVPQNLAMELDSAHLRAVLMHELAHIKRGDLWVNLAQTILQIIYFYNPLLWLANGMIRRVREQAVDEAVLVAMGEKAQQYPQTLLDVAKLAFKRPALSLRLVGVVESRSALAGRIKHILNRPTPKSAKLGIAGLLAVIITGVVLLPMAKAGDDNMSKRSQFTATLPNGVSVELVGVCEHPSEGKQWWRPDGTILSKAPYYTTGSRSTNEKEGYVYYEFALKLSHPDKMSYFWMIPGSGHGSDTGSPSDESGHQIQALKAYATNLPREQKITTVRIGATAGEWQTVATCKPEDREETYSVGEFAIAFGAAYLKGNKTLLPVVHNYNRKKIQYAVRVIAETKSGQVRTSGYSGSGGGKLNSLTYIFNELPLETVKEFHFQIRPYQWVIFRNVSLRPAVETDVQVDVEQAEAVGADSTERAKSTENLKQLALALIMYADDHSGKPAADLKELQPYLGNQNLFEWVLENVEYVGQDKVRRSDGRDHRRPIAYDKTLLAEGSGTNVAFVDGHVEFMPPRRLEELSITW